MVDWPKIVEQHGPCVWRTAFRMLSDREEASDCYQETFLGAHEFSRKHEVANWPALLTRLAASRALDRLRKRYRNRTDLLDDCSSVVGREPAPEVPMEQQEWLDRFRRTVVELPEPQAEVFCLSEIENMAHSEIAAELGTTTKQVTDRLYRAKQKLRQLLIARGMVDEVKR